MAVGSADEQHLLLEKARWTEEVKVNLESDRQQTLALHGAIPARRGRQAPTDHQALTTPSDLPRGQDSFLDAGRAASSAPCCGPCARPEYIIDTYWQISALTH